MRRFCLLAVETARVKSKRKAMERWRESGGGIVLTDNMIGSGDVDDGDETAPG